jgi:serine protease Do
MKHARTLQPAAVVALVWLVAAASALRADTKVTWDPVRTTSPETVDELKALQAKVKEVVAKVSPSTVGLLVGPGAGSGVIVSDDGLVLTAAHVIGRAGVTVRFVMSDGTIVKGKSLGYNKTIDSGMARITDPPPPDADWPGAKDGKWPAAAIGKGTELKKGQWVVSLGHPGGPKQDRRPPVRVGRFENYSKSDHSLRSDCTLVGGDSGGPLFDLTGKVVGIHSRIGLFLEYNMHIPAEAFKDEWDQFVKGEWTDRAKFTGGVEVGLVLDEDEESPTVKKVVEGGPADKAGIKAGDVIVKFDGETIHAADDLSQILNSSEPGQKVEVEVLRGEKTVKMTVTLGRKPSPKKGRGKEPE